MNASGSNVRRVRRCVACVEFAPDEINSLRSLLGLLAPYLKHVWEVADTKQADLVLVHRDREGDLPSIPNGAAVIGCARRPRQHPAPTIHRPFRASEILAVLNELDESLNAGACATAPVSAAAAGTWRLAFWPLDFETFPHAWRRVLAALSTRAMTLDDLARCTRLPSDEVARCLQRLRDTEALIDTLQPSPPRRPPAARWRHLIIGISRKLRLSI